MRHGDKVNNLSRTKAHRTALLRNLSCQLIENKRIFTTLAKAKALRQYVEPLITRSKIDSTHNRRICFARLNSKEAIKELYGVIADKVADRPGGYTRIIKLAPRYGDAAEMAMIELVDFNTIYNPKEDTTKKTRRSRRGSKSKTQTDTTKTQTKSSKTTTADDLTKIEGIGPKIAEALVAAEIDSFKALAARTPEDIKSILEASDGNFNLAITDTWAQQAQLAADGKWNELQKLQDELKGGKEEEIDDLAKVEGIGPKIAEVLIAAGIKTFKSLASKTPEEIKSILEASDGNFNLAVTDTWAQQAQLAADGKWDELQKLQDELKGGKEE